MQKAIDDAVEEFRQKLENEFIKTEHKMTDTQFECIGNNIGLFIADAKELNPGTLIKVDDWEAFCILETSEQMPWITYLGDTYTHV